MIFSSILLFKDRIIMVTKVIINVNVIKNIMWIISHLNKNVTSASCILASCILANTYHFVKLIVLYLFKNINMYLSFKFLRETPRKRV